MSDKIYTRLGDAGETSVVGGVRVPKNSLRICACGSVDEVNSHVGLASTSVDDDLLVRTLTFVQHRLFNCSSSLATPTQANSIQMSNVDPEDVAALERLIDLMTERMGGADGFVLPGGSETSGRLHVARTIVRRAEREILDLAAEEPVDPQVLAFINRLSDLLFTAARYANHTLGKDDRYWDPEAPAPETA